MLDKWLARGKGPRTCYYCDGEGAVESAVNETLHTSGLMFCSSCEAQVFTPLAEFLDRGYDMLTNALRTGTAGQRYIYLALFTSWIARLVAQGTVGEGLDVVDAYRHLRAAADESLVDPESVGSVTYDNATAVIADSLMNVVRLLLDTAIDKGVDRTMVAAAVDKVLQDLPHIAAYGLVGDDLAC